MKRSCARCSSAFEIGDDTLQFLERMAPTFGGVKHAIPPPTHCPDCRQQRRMAFRKERMYYHRDCDLCGEHMIAVYPDKTPFPVYCRTCWWGDKWDGLSHGRTLGSGKPFFDEFAALLNDVPRLYFANVNSENSEYCNQVEGVKNCYLITGSIYSQDCLYGNRVLHCKNCVDCLWVQHCELCYQCTDCTKCYEVREGLHCNNVRDSEHVMRCAGSDNLLFCVGVRRGSYNILNVQYKSDEFKKRRREILASPELLKEHRRQYEKLQMTVPVPAMVARLADNCTGNYIEQARNARFAFDVGEVEDAKYVYDAFKLKDAQDVFSFYGPAELIYEVYSAGIGMFRSMGLCDCWPGSELFYCENCFQCEQCFGCSGLRKKKYCILNKQYTKAEYDRHVAALIGQMRAAGEWGEYFPMRLSPFAYNESVAQEWFPLTESQVHKEGLQWSQRTDPPVQATKIIPAAKLPACIADVPDDVLNWAVECEETRRHFKIIKQELRFYRDHDIPIPRRHPDQRHADRMTLRNPRTLWDRQCAECSKKIKTTYAPDRPEIVYCLECYQQAVH